MIARAAYRVANFAALLFVALLIAEMWHDRPKNPTPTLTSPTPTPAPALHDFTTPNEFIPTNFK